MKITKSLLMKSLATVVLLYASLMRGEAKDVDVTLSDGSSLVLTQPVDVMGLTWKSVKNNLPPVFLIVEGKNLTDEERISQLLSTVNSVGKLYLSRYDSVIGGVEDGADMYTIEDKLSKIKAGKGTISEQRAVSQGDAVALWAAMLEDKADEKGLDIKTKISVPSSEVFLNEYSRALEKGENVDIYTEVVIDAQKSNPSAFSSYLDRVALGRREMLEKITAGEGDKREE